jgi:hypothetical protein
LVPDHKLTQEYIALYKELQNELTVPVTQAASRRDETNA